MDARDPHTAAPRHIDPLPDSVECPWCDSRDTRLEAPFGGILSVAQYYCRDCRTVFEWMKWDGAQGRGER